MKIKQKIVLDVHMPCDKCKTNAKKIAALTGGMTSMILDADKNQLVIVGEGMDVAILATTLRKKVGRTSIISVEEVKSDDKKKAEEAAKKKKEEEEAKKKKEAEEAARNRNVPWGCNYFNNYAPPPYPGYDVQYGVPSNPDSWFSW